MAHAAVVSLHQILEQIILQSDQFPFHFPKPQIEHLQIKVSSLQNFLEKIFPVPNSNKSTVKDLETQIRDAVYAAQDAIESCISFQNTRDESISVLDFQQQLHVVIQEINCIAEKAKEMMATINIRVDRVSKSRIVGLESDMHLLKDRLTGDTYGELQIVPIIGMAGIGKTTLATALYDDPLIKSHFYTRAWVTVSKECHVRDIFSGLLSSMKKLDEEMSREGVDQLGNNLRKSLINTRYFVVVDDIWSTDVWDNVVRFFPDNKNGSKVVVTTRLSNVALYVNPSGHPHVMCLLDLENSWKLLCLNAFADDHCPSHLEGIGMGIANNCRGLGLAIVVIGGLLSKSNNTTEYWRMVEEDTSSAIMGDANDSFMKILSLSYIHLPSQLKGCFLYLGAFREDYEIPVSKLLKLWIAEGFLTPPAASKNLEEAAKEFLVDLIERNLVMVSKLRSNGQIKTCKIHDLVRDLCVKESIKEKFFHVINKPVKKFPEGTDNQRRISVHKNILMCRPDMYSLAQTIKLARSVLYDGPNSKHPLCLTFELLRVLDALTACFMWFPSEIVNLFHLRYLSFTFNGKLPPSISKLVNLLILIVRQHIRTIYTESSVLPVEIWNMPKLRHLEFEESNLPGFPVAETYGQSNSVFLENLQYLSNVNAYGCTKEVLRNVPNLKKLVIWINEPTSLPFYIDELQYLETLKFVVQNPNPGTKVDFQPTLSFPRMLKKLSLSGCGIPWEEMTILGKMEFLQVLKLQEFAFQGPEWESNEDEFGALKFLLLDNMDLVNWRVEDSHFPSLESLYFKHCFELEEMSSDLGNMPSLKLIELVDCNPIASASAMKIQEEQMDYGNEELQVRVYCSWDE